MSLDFLDLPTLPLPCIDKYYNCKFFYIFIYLFIFCYYIFLAQNDRRALLETNERVQVKLVKN